MSETVSYETASPESITYKRGCVYVKLNGFHAWLFQWMVWNYGKARAVDEFWWLWHKKEGSACAERNEMTRNIIS